MDRENHDKSKKYENRVMISMIIRKIRKKQRKNTSLLMAAYELLLATYGYL